jgi:glycerol-3-phosphate dehydrogenase subunit C
VLDSRCCGIAGTYGFKRENYETSQAIGAPLFRQIEESGADIVVTDCETCKWQIEMSTSKRCEHPITLLAKALGNSRGERPGKTLLDEQRLNDVNPAVLAGDLFAVQPAAQHVQRHHGADFLTHRQTVASDAHFDPQSMRAFRRRQREIKVFLIQPPTNSARPAKCFTLRSDAQRAVCASVSCWNGTTSLASSGALARESCSASRPPVNCSLKVTLS